MIHQKFQRSYSKCDHEKKSIHKIIQTLSSKKHYNESIKFQPHHDRFHPRIVNISFIIELQNNFEFQVSNFIQKYSG